VGLSVEDLLQESFIQIFKSLENFDNQKGDFKNWLITIAIRTSIKTAKRFKYSFDDFSIGFDIQSLDETPVDKMSAEELLQLIEKIPSEYRIVFNLYAIDGYSHKEIGEIFGIKESSSRSKLKRARDMIRSFILPQVKEVKAS